MFFSFTCSTTSVISRKLVQRIRQILALAVRKLRYSGRIPYYRDGYETILRRREEEARKNRKCLEIWRAQPETYVKELAAIRIAELSLSLRAANCFMRSSIYTMRDLVDVIENDPHRFFTIRAEWQCHLDECSKIQGNAI